MLTLNRGGTWAWALKRLILQERLKFSQHRLQALIPSMFMAQEEETLQVITLPTEVLVAALKVQ